MFVVCSYSSNHLFFACKINPQTIYTITHSINSHFFVSSNITGALLINAVNTVNELVMRCYLLFSLMILFK